MAAVNSPMDASAHVDDDEGKASFISECYTYTAKLRSILKTYYILLLFSGSLLSRWRICAHRCAHHNTDCKHHPWESLSHRESKLIELKAFVENMNRITL